MPEPTFYFEVRKEQRGLDMLLPVSQGCVHVEWTLTGKAAIQRHLGGNKIENLLRADLNNLAKHNLQLGHENGGASKRDNHTC